MTIPMNDPDDIIRIELEDLPPEEPVIVINLDDLAPEPSVASNAIDFVLELPDIPCAVCHAMIEPGQPFGKCKACQTPYHQECWNYNGGCAVLGCRGKGAKNFFITSAF